MTVKIEVLMVSAAEAGRARQFELGFVLFAHRIEKLQLTKTDSFFLSPYGRMGTKKTNHFCRALLFRHYEQIQRNIAQNDGLD